MAYDEELADRVREHLVGVKGVTEREMFGGISFLVAGNLCCGVLGDDLVVRIDPTLHHDALTRPGAREFEMGGRSSRGMIRVAPVGVVEDLDLSLWLRLGIVFMVLGLVAAVAAYFPAVLDGPPVLRLGRARRPW